MEAQDGENRQRSKKGNMVSEEGSLGSIMQDEVVQKKWSRSMESGQGGFDARNGAEDEGGDKAREGQEKWSREGQADEKGECG